MALRLMGNAMRGKRLCPICDHSSLIFLVEKKIANLLSRTNQTNVRTFAIDTSTSSAFDRDLKQKQRDRAARTHNLWRNTDDRQEDGDDDIVEYDYFRQEMAYRLVDRLDDIKREEGFPLALDIGKFSFLTHFFSKFVYFGCLGSMI